MECEVPDATVERLRVLFARHPAWLAAAARLSDDAVSNVYFRHRPGEAWHLARRRRRTELRPGAARDPDFVFRFPAAAVDRLAAVEGGVGDFAIALFSLMADDDATRRVDFRVAAPFSRLARRGYLRLLLGAGPGVLAFGAARGVRTLGQLGSLVRRSRAEGPFEWEA